MDLRVFGYKPPGEIFPFPRRSSHALPCYLKRLSLTLTALLLLVSVDFRPTSKRTSHKIFGPTAFPVEVILFFIPPFEGTFEKRCPALRKPRVQGLATLFAAVFPNNLNLGSLFQPPTLMGFALQSFSPFR